MEVIAVLYMQDWHICVPADFSLGFEGDNNAVTLEISTDLPEGWDLKVDVAKDGEKNIIQLNRRDNVYYALLTSSMLADDGVYEMQVRGTLGDQVRHSNIFLSHVHNSINATDSFPPPLPSEFEQMEDRLTSINNNPPQPGENGYWLIWDPDDMEYKESDIPHLRLRRLLGQLPTIHRPDPSDQSQRSQQAGHCGHHNRARTRSWDRLRLLTIRQLYAVDGDGGIYLK